MSDVEQVSGENEIEIATGVTKTCITPVKQHQLHHHHHHHHHQKQQQLQQQQQYRQQNQQQQQQQQQQRLSSTLTIEEGVVDRADLIETRHPPGHSFLSRVLKVLFSTPGLVVLVVVYSVMGALIFPMLEAPQDIRKNVAIAKSREDCLKELWIITEKLNVLYERNWTMLVHEQLRRFEGSIVAATRNGGGGSSSVGNTAALTGFETDKGRWSFSEALLYSVTVITTIGHGNLTPKSSAGKIATILYALIGVPLMLMCLSSLGGLLAEALQCTYTRICCRLQRVQRQHQHHHHHQQHRKAANESGVGSGAVGECESGAVTGASRDGENGGGSTRRKSIDSTGSSSCHGQSHEMDCKSCKYDAVNGETSIHNSFKYGSLAEREDSCQLLHSSPNKMLHNSPCIQLKSQPAPPPNLKQYHHLAMAQHQLQQQQQQHQQMSPQHQNYQMSPSNTTANTINTYHQQQVMVPNNVHAQQHYHHQQQQQQQHLVQQNGCTEITGTATIYFPIATATPGNPLNLPVSAAAVHYNHQPLVKYHTIQLQHKKAMPVPMPMTMPASAPLTGTTVSGATIFEQQLPGHTLTVGTGVTTLTLPPPPPHYQTATVHGIRRAKFLAKPMPQEINTLLAESDISCRHDVSGGSPVNQPRASSESGNSSSTPGSVDIMEDEEENEQNRMGCPHGTPSRVPLISSSTSGRKNPSNDSKTLDSRKLPPSTGGASAGQRRRVRLITTNNSKSGHKSNCCLDSSCNLHTDHTEDEDEDDDDEDDDDEDNYGEDNDGPPQVPITVVLLILVAYICLGTVIFAFWENWSLIDGAYFCFVTLSTIGYADFMPQHTFQGPDVQLFACCAYLLLGLVLVAMSFSILETQLMWKCKRIAVRLKLARD